MKTMKDILLEFFEDEASEIRVVIEKASEISLDYKLTPETRTVLELINHIAQIPRIDVGIYSGELSSGEITHKMELDLNKTTVSEILQVFDESCQYLHSFFSNLSEDDLQKENLIPFYEQDSKPKAWAHFLPKLTAHLALHKGILWAYLKSAKTDVNMFTYYGVKN